VTPRGKRLAALTALLALAVPGLVAAQVAPPRMVDENDVEEAPPPPPPVPPVAPPPDPVPAAPAPKGGQAGPAVVPGPTPVLPPSPGPPAGPPASNSTEPARKAIPVRASWAKLMEAWSQRRRALRDGDSAKGAEEALLAAQRELAIENLLPQAAAEVRGVRDNLRSNLVDPALSRAEVAVTLAPDWPEAHLVRARALLASSRGGVGPALGAAVDGVAAGFRDPEAVRAFRADVLGALLAALAAASLVALVLLSLSRLGLVLHDFHHLPLLGGTARVQAAFLALVLMATPVALGLGPLAVVLVLVLFAWLYLTLAERLVASCALLVLFALPWAAEQAAALTVWTGTAAAEVQRIEHGALSDAEAAAAIKALPADAPAPLLAALGHHLKRRGDLAGALQLYRRAAEADPHAPEILVNIGNVLFLQDDLDGARAVYLAAQDRAEGDLVARGTAAYNLSKLFVRTSEMEKSSAARANAEQMAGAFLAAHGSDEDFSANHYLVDVPVPAAKISALASSDPAPAALCGALEAGLVGEGVGGLWPWLAGASLAVLWALALAGTRLDPARTCFRCGRPVCRRCDGATGASCGQCVNVFEKKGVVDARDQRRKEQQVRRHRAWAKRVARGLAVVLGGGGHLVAGAPVRGTLYTAGIAFCAFLIVFWPGLAPPRFPSSLAFWAKLALAAPLGLALWWVAVRDLFRRTGG
jgi:tetratricopeptide (TPR) repeat protein